MSSESVRILLLGSALSKQIIGGFNTDAFSMPLLNWSSHRSHHHSRENAAGRKKDLQTEVLKERRCTEADGELQEPEGIIILSISRLQAKMTVLLRMTEKKNLH